jgi:hypothetical protein
MPDVRPRRLQIPSFIMQTAPHRNPTPSRYRHVVADAALTAALFGALPAAFEPALIFLIPVSIAPGVLVGAGICFASSRRTSSLSLALTVLGPAIFLASLPFLGALLSHRPTSPSSPLPEATVSLSLYGAFVGAGAGLGSATALSRRGR